MAETLPHVETKTPPSSLGAAFIDNQLWGHLLIPPLQFYLNSVLYRYAEQLKPEQVWPEAFALLAITILVGFAYDYATMRHKKYTGNPYAVGANLVTEDNLFSVLTGGLINYVSGYVAVADAYSLYRVANQPNVLNIPVELAAHHAAAFTRTIIDDTLINLGAFEPVMRVIEKLALGIYHHLPIPLQNKITAGIQWGHQVETSVYDFFIPQTSEPSYSQNIPLALSYLQEGLKYGSRQNGNASLLDVLAAEAGWALEEYPNPNQSDR